MRRDNELEKAIYFVIFVAIYLMLLAALVPSSEHIPHYVKSFCHAQAEVYQIPYDDCIKSYHEHKK